MVPVDICKRCEGLYTSGTTLSLSDSDEPQRSATTPGAGATIKFYLVSGMSLITLGAFLIDPIVGLFTAGGFLLLVGCLQRGDDL
jgi:hypothetical protein